MLEPREPRLTKTQRAQRDREITAQAAAKKAKTDEINFRNRRLLISSLVVGTATLALGGAAAIIARQTAPALPQTGNEIPARLKDLDAKVKRDVNLLSESTLEIAEMALDSFTSETGRDKISLGKTFEYFTRTNDFSNRVRILAPCDLEGTPSDVVAVTIKGQDKMLVDLAKITAVQNPKTGYSAASQAYETVLHELGHLTTTKANFHPELAPLFPGANLPGSYTEGLTIYRSSQLNSGCQEQSKPSITLEEGLVQAQAELIIKNQGYSSYKPGAYQFLMSDFRAVVTEVNSKEGFKQLFATQGRSDLVGFFSTLGVRFKASNPNMRSLSPLQAGYSGLLPYMNKFEKQI